jgi:hypothetical protein
MIEDNSIGLKVAEDSDVALWESLRKEALELIKQSENNIKIQKAMLEMAERKLDLIEYHKDMEAGEI